MIGSTAGCSEVGPVYQEQLTLEWEVMKSRGAGNEERAGSITSQNRCRSRRELFANPYNYRHTPNVVYTPARAKLSLPRKQDGGECGSIKRPKPDRTWVCNDDQSCPSATP